MLPARATAPNPDGTTDASPAATPDERVAALGGQLNAAALPTARERLATMGETASGMYNFYAVRIARDDLFGDYERALAAALLAGGLPRAVHEIGGGIGSFAWLMAGLGCRTTCFEHDARRFAAAQALWIPIAMAMPALAARLELCPDRFPSARVQPGRATAVATNLVFTTTPEQRVEIVVALARYPEVVIDLDRFLASTGAEARDATVAEFAAAGLAGEPLLDLGSSACFWRFRQREG